MPPPPRSAAEWTAAAKRSRDSVLREIVYYGWPREWVEAPPRFEDLGEVPAGPGYRMRKLRYEIVPGFYSTAILYEPARKSGRMPAVLNVNGHVGPLGKAVEYKQKRCINQALQGMFALNLEWIAYGELAHPENGHFWAAHLGLAGANPVGLFYLAMRRGLDYLYDRPDVDRSRLAVTGLSGGGWQTITLSALDERVAVSVPVAGYSSIVSRIERNGDVGDIEQNPPDLLRFADYDRLTAMRAPRPTLLIYNSEDDCCFRAPLVKSYVYDRILPFFRLYDAEDKLAWHLNTDPADHNYQLDNRQAAYRFITRAFGLPPAEWEIPVNDQIKTVDELRVGLPSDNLTVLGLAKELARRARGGTADSVAALPAPQQRELLKQTVRYSPVAVEHAWAVHNTMSRGLETVSYRLSFANRLTATGVSLQALAVPANAPLTILLNDQGKKESGAAAAERVNRGDLVFALDLLYTGDGAPARPALYTQMVETLGERNLGLEAAQLIATARWLLARRSGEEVRVEASGIRSQLVTQVAAALEPQLFSHINLEGAMRSLRHIFEAPIPYEQAPDVFCLDLYKRFDMDTLAALAAPAKVSGL
jgi:dienelactone hydrolase